MKRKPTIKSLRVGQTIWYPAYEPSAQGVAYKLRGVAVLSDSAPLTPAYIIADGFPRWFIRDSLADGTGPVFASYSRRKVVSWIKAHGRVMP